MRITNITLYPSSYANQGTTKAYGQLEIENSIVLDIEVAEKSEREQWVRFPGYKKIKDKATGSDKTVARVFIKNEALKNAINSEVLGKYNREIKYKNTKAPEGKTENVAKPSSNNFPF